MTGIGQDDLGLIVRLLDPNSEEYGAALGSLIRCCDERVAIEALLRREMQSFGSGKSIRAIDYGAGTGALSAVPAEKAKVWAVEPNPYLLEEIRKLNRPEIVGVSGDILRNELPAYAVEADLILCSHVLYYVRTEGWRAHTAHMLRRLRVGGKLIEILKHPNTGCQEMIDHFGGPVSDLYSLVPYLARRLDLSFEYIPLSGVLRTASLEETIQIARFMITDRPADDYANLPSEDEFVSYVQNHFWDDERSVGGWDIPNLALVVTRLS